MAAPFSTLRSKLDRAIVAWLIQQGVADSVFPANNSGIIQVADGPVVVVRSHSGFPVTADAVGGPWQFDIEVGVHGSASPQPEDANQSDQQRYELDQVFAATVDALMQSDVADGQTLQLTADGITSAGQALASVTPVAPAVNLNLDMVDFACDTWLPPTLDGGNPRVENAPTNTTVWKEIANFKAICRANGET